MIYDICIYIYTYVYIYTNIKIYTLSSAVYLLVVQGGLSVDSSTKGRSIRVDTGKKHRLTTGKQKDGSPLLSTLDKKT